MRIAMVIDPYDHPFNGTVVSTRRFVRALAAEGVRVRLLAIGNDTTGAVHYDNDAGVERVDFPELHIPLVQTLIDRMRAPLAKPVRARVRSALADCDLLHVQYPFFLGAVALKEARRLGLPVIASFHVQPENILRNLGLPDRWLAAPLYGLFRRFFYQPSELVLAPSEYAARLLRQQGVETPVMVLSNGIPERFFALEHDAAIEGAASQGCFRVLSVGRLAAEKDQRTLIEAVARSRFASRIQLQLIGTGPRHDTLEKQALARGVALTIGPVSDAELDAALARADLFVHCGRVELEGMSVLEAMAAQNAVLIASAEDSACPSIITEPAQQFPVGDAVALAAQMDRWLADSDGRSKQGTRNREIALGYAHGASVQRLLGVYRERLPQSQLQDAGG